MTAVFDEAGVDQLYALFSGGHDSLCATSLASQHRLFAGVVHINTGIGIEETRMFVRDTCVRQGWPLTEVRAPEGLYEELVLKRGGFPWGIASHNSMLWHLKQKPMRQWLKTLTGKTGLVTGIRRQESIRRMGAGISEPIRVDVRDKRHIWISPLLDWSRLDCNQHINSAGLHRNPVVDLLHRSGECLCGALASQEEIRELRDWFPDAAKRINQLEAKCEQRGIVASVWAGREARNLHPDQMRIFPKTELMPLCISCEENFE